MRTLALLPFLLVACQKATASAPAPAPAPAPASAPKAEAAPPGGGDDDDGPPSPNAAPQTLAQLMRWKLSPYAAGKSTDEAAFRYALGQLRELAPPDSNFNSGPRPWFQIVDDMLAQKDTRRGCQECHRQFKRAYESRYGDAPIVWVNPQ